MTTEYGVDRWPAFDLSPAEYERAVAELVEVAGHEVTAWDVRHLDPVEGVDGTYVIDVTVRFRLLGADFLVLFECKRHASPVKREHVQVLKDKLRSTGAHKGVVVAAGGFQSGALEYARVHRIACVRLLDGAWTYEVRAPDAAVAPRPTGRYVAYAQKLTNKGFSCTRLGDRRDDVLEHVFKEGPAGQRVQTGPS
ncbi:restriction endonuclease [Planotetraspora sp. GP83]|uniref:restriction endonuclease n=1 Tax=Planotetraspora sp. GP83 TaxID=3156264 RepID=UPI0035127EC1